LGVGERLRLVHPGARRRQQVQRRHLQQTRSSKKEKKKTNEEKINKNNLQTLAWRFVFWDGK
jgi:hypothetical protein